MKAKVKVILDNLIRYYIESKQPISSTKLKEVANLPFSPSSIRGYLQDLEKQGFIQKVHSSGGSYPSKNAMIKFWKEHLKPFKIDINQLKKQSQIAIIIQKIENQLLKEVYNYKDKFIILEFEKEEIVFKFDKNLYKLFLDLKMIDINSLYSSLKRVKLEKQSKKIEALFENIYINPKILYQYFNTEIKISSFKEGINIKDDILAYRFLYKDKQIYDVVLVGNIYSNFLSLRREL